MLTNGQEAAVMYAPGRVALFKYKFLESGFNWLTVPTSLNKQSHPITTTASDKTCSQPDELMSWYNNLFINNELS